jgi:hypothetical protein
MIQAIEIGVFGRDVDAVFVGFEIGDDGAAGLENMALGVPNGGTLGVDGIDLAAFGGDVKNAVVEGRG